MKCPNCDGKLELNKYQGIEVEQCQKCKGMWFESHEVDLLEDTVFDQDEFKGTMITNVKESEKNCPKCEQKMKRFNYRFEDLELDFCANGDGYWLDKNEENRIEEIISQEKEDLDRKFKVEEKWGNALKGLQSPTLISKIKSILGL
ncbi:MAG: hypothetical protein UR89_C0004G0014 [Candidatus Roizmanbacteria bacterium GW2011_GWA2_35_8]|uniref:Transcription factor zinc-finger domain-containing protein n=1 Tax=Candidatus Roizmanbacteria bacterium GW2011_GWA2_35_8 TaxID=1618479 RepID=A0A0G0FI95_9BACT|nr:MAG: hypothetical protein UR89_C0004G0014 [Candidatus Roizmanbacteria bacterium GW2011_GWA2_35_8]